LTTRATRPTTALHERHGESRPDRRQRVGSGVDRNIIPLAGPFDRDITLRIFGASAIVVVRNDQTGLFSEVRVPIPDFETTIRLPEPAGMSVVALMSLVALRRWRR
jgi:hypothetical protein